MKIFVLADTHNKSPAIIADLARDADEIWHLGDVCSEHILDELQVVGPPVALVRGNCDSNTDWPITVDLQRNGVRCRLQHIPPSIPPNDCDLLLHGHTHVPRDEIVGGVRFLNPGCVTRPNKGAPASVAFLVIDRPGVIHWTIRLLR